VSRRIGRWLHSLQAQLLLWTILPVTLVVVGLSLAGVYSHQEEMHDFVVQRDQILARLLAADLRDKLAQGSVTPDADSLAQWMPIAHAELTGRVFIVDGVGQILATSEEPSAAHLESELGSQEILAQDEGTVTIRDHMGNQSILTFAAVEGTEWQVIVHAEVAELIGPILRFSRLGPIAALAAVTLSLTILSFGWRTVARPLQQLSKVANSVSWGKRAVIQQRITGVTEIETLHHALQEMVARLETYQTELLDYMDAVTKGQEEERARLAREVHDGPVQSLIVLTQRTEIAKLKLQRGDYDGTDILLEQLRAAEVAVVEDLRRIIGALRPVYLEDLGFVPALDVLVHNAATRTHAEVSLSVTGKPRRLTPDVELAAYRITQEALTNAMQHARADHISVTVHYDHEGVWLQIVDDGTGFEPGTNLNSHTHAGHFGLVGLAERARHLEGTFQVDSQPGAGTMITVRLPDHCDLQS
jgi:signal transduction histidine kinase